MAIVQEAGEVSENQQTAEVPIGRFDRNKFIRETGTGKEVINGEVVKEEQRWFDFSEETQKEYSNFMENHISNLLRVDASVLDDPEFASDKLLIDMFTEPEKDQNGDEMRDVNDGHLIRTVNMEKVKQYLQTERGWMTANA